MTFLNMLGLLGLLGLLLLIIIYILKPKYQEQVISSSFIWKLSLKYKRKKLPFEWLKSSLLLVLQVLIILTMITILMKPNLVSRVDSGEKVVILDISASMLAEDNNETRLERAISEIDRLAKETIANNDRFSLIISGKDATMLAFRSDSYEFIRTKLSEVDSHYSTSNIDDAMLLTEEILEINPSTSVLYFTSESYEDPGQVIIKDMSKKEWNIAILGFEGAYDLSMNYVFTVEVASYGKDIDDLIIQLDTDGERINSTTIDLVDGVPNSFSWKMSGYNEDDFDIATVKTLEITDDFTYDNTLSYFSSEERFKVQILSQDTTESVDSTREYIASALRSLPRGYDIKVVTDIELVENEGFDLYIYSGSVPATLPQDGAIWIFDPTTLPSELEVAINGEVTIESDYLSAGSATTDSFAEILKLVRVNEISVSKYKTFSNVENYDVLMSHDANPVMLFQDFDGVKVSIFAFSLAYSNLPILFFDFPVLVNNLSNYSVIPTFDQDVYDGGDNITLYANPMTETLTVTSASGTTDYTVFPVELTLSDVGVYTITQHFSDDRVKTEYFFVRVPMVESQFNLNGDTITSPIITDNQNGNQYNEKLMDLLPFFAIALLAFLIIEWEVQYREQY